LTHAGCSPWELADIPLRYPTVNELVQYCFGPDVTIPEGAEKLFTDAYARNDWVVLKRLTTILQGADHYIATPLSLRESAYSRFFNRFMDSAFISYNYDCLVELFLQQRGRWNPQSGFGVNAEAYKPAFPIGPELHGYLGASVEVLHIHGSLYLYPIESDLSTPDQHGTQWLTMRSSPRFIFDPDSLGASFPGYSRPLAVHGYSAPEQRFIPPIADKAESIEQAYYRIVTQNALERIHDSDRAIAIGYSFASSDKPSYDSFLRELFSRSGILIVIAPSSQLIAERLRLDYRSYSPTIEYLPMTFSQWDNAGFPRGSE